MKIRYPSVSGGNALKQVAEIRTWIHQLVDQLNNEEATGYGAVRTVEKGTGTRTSTDTQSGTSISPIGTFNSIKALIIKSADIVNAYYDQISTRLDGMYVGVSEFGTYKEQTSATIAADAQQITQAFSKIEEIEGNVTMMLQNSAWIKTGLLDTGIYGIEVGQRTEENGVEVFNKYARFTAQRLSFYDKNGIEVAYISDRKLYITEVQVLNSLVVGNFEASVRADKSVVEKWIGGS